MTVREPVPLPGFAGTGIPKQKRIFGKRTDVTQPQ